MEVEDLGAAFVLYSDMIQQNIRHPAGGEYPELFLLGGGHIEMHCTVCSQKYPPLPPPFVFKFGGDWSTPEPLPAVLGTNVLWVQGS